MKMRFGVKTDKGLIRGTNEDSCSILAGYSGVPITFIIADGMGGHNSGEIASKMAVDIVSGHILKGTCNPGNEDDVITMIREAMDRANTDIYRESSRDGSNSGMGTTLIVASVINKKIVIGHVGDSRAYKVCKDKIEKITTDHSFVEELVRNGSLTREEARTHPGKNLITRALGCTEKLEIDTYICDFNEDDCFILCTDGLTNMLGEDEIREIVNNAADPQTACSELIMRANEKGGEDNTTVIVIMNN